VSSLPAFGEGGRAAAGWGFSFKRI
jgi:hypothetical protein